jgi:hypothetical protein
MAEELGVDAKIVPKSAREKEMLRDYMEEEKRKEYADQFSEDDVSADPKARYYDAKYAEYAHVAQLSPGIDRIPEDILKRAQKVFSKHNSREIREWTKQLMKSYQLLHAVEKPMNLDYV